MYILYLVATAKDNCPNVDTRISNSIIQQQFGSALRSREDMSRMGLEILKQNFEQLAKPNEAIRNAMDDSEWEGDARADMTAFVGQHGCSEEVNSLLRNAARVY